MANSSLVDYTILSPNHSGARKYEVTRITPHCIVGQLSVATACGCFRYASQQASCNYTIGTEGKVGLVVPEAYRSWCSSSTDNDNRAITIECASDSMAPYAFNSTVYNKLIDLCVDVCQRYGKTKLLWIGDKNTALSYEPKSNEMLLTVHRWFKNKACPGDWLMARMDSLAASVTSRLTEGDDTVITYNTIDEVPTYCKDTISKLIAKGYYTGGTTGLALTQDMARILTILDRAGVFDK